MVSALPRVLVLHTGGTLMMRAQSEQAHTLTPDVMGRDVARELPVLSRIAELETRVLFSMDSGDMRPEHWVAIAREVHAALTSQRYAGVVVVHGTDTMAYSASALALMLGRLPAPVVLTGAQRPLGEARTDARENMVDAVLVATLPVHEVSIVFAARALRGARSTKKDAWAYEAFEAPHCPPLVELGLDVEVGKHALPKGVLAPFDDRIEPRVRVVRVYPGIEPVIPGLDGARGVVLSTYGTGNLPQDFVPAIAEASARGIPVLVVSQCPRGFVDMTRYAGGAKAAEAGAISGGDMTIEAAIAKMMIGLGRHGPGEALRAYLEGDTVGERT